MVFDAFAVDFGCLFADAELSKKLLYDFMAVPRLAGEFSSGGGEFDRLVGFACGKAIADQPRDGIVDRSVSDAEAVDEIQRSTDSRLTDDVIDRFDIVFGQFGRVVQSRALVYVRIHWQIELMRCEVDKTGRCVGRCRRFVVSIINLECSLAKPR